MWAVGWGSLWHHTAAGCCCPEQMWFGWRRPSPMASGTDPARPAEIKSLPGSRAHCRPSVDQEVLWKGQPLWTFQSFWKCDSHWTKGCLADLNQKEEKADEFILMASIYITASWRSRCPHYLLKNRSTLRDEMNSPLSVLPCNSDTWMNESCQFLSLTITANGHWALTLCFVLSIYLYYLF